VSVEVGRTVIESVEVDDPRATCGRPSPISDTWPGRQPPWRNRMTSPARTLTGTSRVTAELHRVQKGQGRRKKQ
jgi:hypothetical protein